MACGNTCWIYLSHSDCSSEEVAGSDLLGHFYIYVLLLVPLGTICLGKFWFSFHGVKALWHFQRESTVTLHLGACFIRHALRKPTHRLTFRIYQPFSASNKAKAPVSTETGRLAPFFVENSFVYTTRMVEFILEGTKIVNFGLRKAEPEMPVCFKWNAESKKSCNNWQELITAILIIRSFGFFPLFFK